MGEYAARKSDNQRVKIGTCESMYYLRFEDRNKVRKEANSLDPASCLNLFWRLPFADEDSLQPGEYEDFNRGLRLYRMHLNANGQGYAVDYENESLASEDEGRKGTIQLKHESGLLLNVPCYHGERLPNLEGAKTFWNGKTHAYELAFLKNTAEGVLPVIRCRHCGNMWRMEWAEIWDFIEPEMQRRLKVYKETPIRKTA